MLIVEEHNLRQVSISGNSVRCKICNYLLSGSIGWQKRGPPVEMMLNCRTDWQRATEDCGRLPRALWRQLDGEGRYWSRLSHKRQRPYLFWCAVFAWGARPLEMELSHWKERPLTLAAAPGQNKTSGIDGGCQLAFFPERSNESEAVQTHYAPVVINACW